MKKNKAYIVSLAILMGLGLAFSSCKEDDPPAKPKLSFEKSTMTVNEDKGTVEVAVLLDKPYSKDLRIEYDLSGTAKDQASVGTADADYEDTGDGVVKINSGETEGTIELEIYNDALFEDDETIVISITDTNTDEIELTEDREITITIKSDDAQVQAFFASTSMTVNEAYKSENGLLMVPVQLDKAAPADITVEYTLGGSAIDSTAAFKNQPQIPPQYYDYYINIAKELYGKVVIPKGATTANIEISIYSDFLFEDDETIEITLKPGTVQIGTNNKMTITVQQQDGKVIALEWDDAYTDVDMDLFLWAGTDLNSLNTLVAFSNFEDVTEKLELVFIPSIITGGYFGLSHNYYSGTADPMNFTVRFIDFADGALEDPATEEVFTATYSLANRNAYQETKVNPVVVQTFRIENSTFLDITDITVPASGSRMRTSEWKLPAGFKRSSMRLPRPL